ncbi:MAG: hypothetical protein AB1679_02500 [Actinomycetota bacterium]
MLGFYEVLVALLDETIDQVGGDQGQAPPAGNGEPFVPGQFSAAASDPFGFGPEHREDHLRIPGVIASHPFVAIQLTLERTGISDELFESITGPVQQVPDAEEVFHGRGRVHPRTSAEIGRVIAPVDDASKALGQRADG